MSHGKAFEIGTANAAREKFKNGLPVFKTWTHLQGRTFLVEELPLEYVANELETLPSPSDGMSAIDSSLAEKFASNKRLLPALRGPLPSTNQIQVSALDLNKQPGLVLDYIEVLGDYTNYSSFTFSNNTTYYISSDFNVYYDTILQAGAVLKFAPGAALNLLAYDMYPIDCQTTAENPAIFTSKDDNSIGEVIAGTCVPDDFTVCDPPAMDNFHLNFEIMDSAVEMRHIHFYYGGIWGPINSTVNLDDVQVHHAGYGIGMYGGNLVALNCLIHDVDLAFFLEAVPADIENLTLDQCSWLWSCEEDGRSFALTNSILIGAGDLSYIPLVTNAVIFLSTNTGVFSGDYYLATNSPYRDVGTTNINTNLLAELEVTTTFPPATWSNRSFVPPDNDGLPDLGYHSHLTGDSDHDGILDSWEFYYFGTLAFGPTNLDASGNTLLSDYQNNLDPNVIRFSIETDNDYVSVTNVNVRLDIAAGNPSYYAIFVDSAASTNWVAFTTTNLSLNLGATDGVYTVFVGLRGLPTEAAQTWQSIALTKETVPPQIVLTNLTDFNGSRPFIDPAGYVTKALSSLTIDITNSDGVPTHAQGSIVDRECIPSDMYHTTNWFVCFDVALTEGTNQISIHATDWAGNTATTNFNFVFDVSNDTNPPAISLLWPQDGMEICGNSFTLRGVLDDDTASIAAETSDTNGDTQINGLVERGGQFWLEDLPLHSGTNSILITSTDAAGNTATTNITVVQSSVTVTMNPVNESDLNKVRLNVSGTISEPSFAVWVNGVEGTNNGDGTWAATNVPVTAGGTATFDITAYPADYAPSVPSWTNFSIQQLVYPNPQPEDPAQASMSQDKPAVVYVKNWHQNLTLSADAFLENTALIGTQKADWSQGGGGSFTFDSRWNRPTGEHMTYRDVFSWPADAGFLPSLGGQECIYTNGILKEQYDVGPFWMEIVYQVRTMDSANLWEETVTNPVWNCSANQIVMLFTGGKAGRQTRSVFALSAGLNEYEVNPGWENGDHGFGQSYPGRFHGGIRPQEISLGAYGPLGADSRRWITEADGQIVDISPKACQKWKVGALPNASKHRLFIQANSSILRPDRVVSNANYCVGQCIYFSPVWSPPLPEEPQKNPIIWGLPGLFVNTNLPPQYTDGSGTYTNDPAWLRVESTHAWWYDGKYSPPTYNASFGEGLTFANGQYVAINANGKFTMHRPRLVDYSNQTNEDNIALLGSLVDPNGITTGQPQMSLQHFHAAGYPPQSRPADKLIVDPPAFYSVRVDSLFDGVAGSTQIITDHAADSCESFDVTNVLDASEFAYGWNFPVISGILSGECSMLLMIDYPNMSCGGTFTSRRIDANDYVRFRPDGGPGPNIYVTLGKIHWHASGSTSLVGIPGTSDQDYAPLPTYDNEELLTFDSNGAIDGTAADTQAFPFWLHTSHAFGFGCPH